MTSQIFWVMVPVIVMVVVDALFIVRCIRGWPREDLPAEDEVPVLIRIQMMASQLALLGTGLGIVLILALFLGNPSGSLGHLVKIATIWMTLASLLFGLILNFVAEIRIARLTDGLFDDVVTRS